MFDACIVETVPTIAVLKCCLDYYSNKELKKKSIGERTWLAVCSRN